MSVANSLLRASITAGAPGFVRELRPTHLLEEEVPAYQFVRDHLNRHGVLPSLETCMAAGIDLGRSTEPPSYYRDELNSRFAYNEVNTRHPEFANAMRSRNMPEVLRILREMLVSASGSISAHQYSSLAAEVRNVLADYEYARLHPGLRGVTLGWPTLDDVTLGAQGGDLIVIAGRPSMGKSWMILESAYKAWLSNFSSIFISMEMTLMQIARRIVGRRSGINPNLIRAGQLSSWADNILRHTIEDIEVSGVPIHFLAGDLEKSVDGVRQMAEEFGPDIIYIDAAYFLKASARKRGYVTRWEEIAEVIKELKQLAIALNRPIVITVQFNRNVKANSTKELDLGDIGGSDSIPQDASVVDGLQQGPAPFQKFQRIHNIMKNREGEVTRFATNLRFTPVNFDEVPLVLPESTQEEQVVNTQWML